MELRGCGLRGVKRSIDDINRQVKVGLPIDTTKLSEKSKYNLLEISVLHSQEPIIVALSSDHWSSFLIHQDSTRLQKIVRTGNSGENGDDDYIGYLYFNFYM